ncbi:zona pellucida sperm-binding protein 3-like [Sparus aurata]|uniref:Zona pellucida sperm-binding protein 3 n=1 Tax=Sparus aurata TaxID=8175 RepID=A0A671VC56_SPAAU|nr:zona pellucida sperm-binding protein 3-like [Sparus aurata]
MGSSRLIVLGFVLACVRLSDARFPGMRLPIYQEVEVQKPAEVEAEPAAGPEREHSRESAQQAGRLQSKQIQPAVEPLPWKYPEDPVDPHNKPPVKFELRQPGKTNRVAVRCGESWIQVEASQDLLGLGKLIKPEEITLGGCSATDIDKGAHVLIFECDLHSCGSTLMMTESDFIYAFTLVYNPKVSGRSPIIRSQSAVIGVQCHYPRKHSVQSSRPYPAWMAHKDTAVAEKQPQFSLQLMSDDWKSERTSSKFTLRDIVSMQASVIQHMHPPLRVLVDSCVATMMPDPTSEPAHAFIKSHGCLGDRHSSSSRFRLQSQPNKLQFQVEALSLHLLKTIYITCKLKAIPASSAVTIEHKACSFTKHRWRALGGKDQFCACCESSCGMRKVGDLDADTGEQWQAELTLGPIVVTNNHYMFKQ